MTQVRINLCASPRNISTALMYSFGNRKDMTVIDEPLYAYYLHNFDIDYHPGKQEILASMRSNADEVIDWLVHHDFGTPYVFFKNMTHHYKGLTATQMHKLLSNTLNIVLFRHPYEMIRSFSKVITQPTMQDLGIDKQAELIEYLLSLDTLAAIVDSNEVLQNPQKALSDICGRCKIPFDQAMLQWQAGARKEDGIWAKYWYANVHSSTGFMPYSPCYEKISPHLEALYEACVPHYQAIMQHKLALKIDA